MSDQEIPDTRDTTPPVSWLEQFKAYSSEAFGEIEELIKSGLQPAENEVLIHAAAQLIRWAQVHDIDALEKVILLLPTPSHVTKP